MLISSAIGAEDMTHAQKASHVPFPESYRSWQLVKSIVVGPDSPLSAMRGGIHHYYANPAAIIGYQTGKFPDGAVIVDEAMWMKAGEGMAKGIWMENEVRFLEVMSKDAALYSTSGGWGYQRFEGDDHQGKLDTDSQAHCFACHEKAKDRDHVYSSLRP
jgi:hypothetical protein